MRKIYIAAAIATLFAACGDDAAEVSDFTGVADQTGLTVIARGDSMPVCSKDNVGEMIFVSDSAAVYYCADDEWTTLNGKDGSSVIDTVVVNNVDTLIIFESDSVVISKLDTIFVSNQDTIFVSNQDTIVVSNQDTIVVSNQDTIVVRDTVIGLNGLPGKDGKTGAGCTVVDLGDGVVKVTCGTYEDRTTAILYKAMCGTKPYDPIEKFCFEGEFFSCNDKPYDPTYQICEKEKIIAISSMVKPGNYYKTNIFAGQANVYVTTDFLNPDISYGEFLDTRDNQVYKTVTIGSQTWMAQNLNYNYNQKTAHSYCGGGSDAEEGDCSMYGRLYTWSAAIDSVALSNAGYTCGNRDICDRLKAENLKNNPLQGVCPRGWHLPDTTEWNALFDATGGKEVAGEKLKTTSSWNRNNGDNSYGFSVLPAGINDYNGNFVLTGDDTFFWSATQWHDGLEQTYYFSISYFSGKVYQSVDYKRNGLSVRCIKDN